MLFAPDKHQKYRPPARRLQPAAKAGVAARAECDQKICAVPPKPAVIDQQTIRCFAHAARVAVAGEYSFALSAKAPPRAPARCMTRAAVAGDDGSVPPTGTEQAWLRATEETASWVRGQQSAQDKDITDCLREDALS
jgi:hypothetical protein